MTENAQQSTVQQKTQQSFVSLQVITASCHAVQNTNFVSPPTKPDWFDGLDSKLTAAKATAGTWVNTLAEDVTSTIPAAVIDYSTTYSALTGQIHEIAKAHPDASGKDNQYVKEVAALIAGMIESVDNIITKVEAVNTKLTQWGKDMQTSHDDLTKGAANIQAAETDLQTDITKMNGAIKNLNTYIDNENKAIAVAAGAIGVGLLLLVAGIALAPETGGASLLVAATGGIAVVGGAVTWGVMQSKINEQYKEIAADTKELNDDKKQLLALQGLGQASDLAIRSIANATTALSDFKTSWGVFTKELQGVVTKLNSAEDSLMVIVQEAFTDAAAQEWGKALEFAQDLAEQKVPVQTKDPEGKVPDPIKSPLAA